MIHGRIAQHEKYGCIVTRLLRQVGVTLQYQSADTAAMHKYEIATTDLNENTTKVVALYCTCESHNDLVVAALSEWTRRSCLGITRANLIMLLLLHPCSQ